ncbi:ROK family transcriptional regulator [Vibrio ouci]|uniref:ROK family transcriptional regulator n=1 Tax=Vibrio ouci TaxID=2499078 RepID=A0A4Y8WBW7_9VIBR|nr:ROK family transcriptional regulator [Vibrio ouci]TFH90430.1 ROK family transcriptional regulator [Vibrio ouci]
MLHPIKPVQLELTPGQKKILATCRQEGLVSRAKIVELTGLRSGSVTSISKELLAMNLIKEGARVRIGRGQPIIPLELNPYAAFSFGIAFHIQRIDIGLANFCGTLVDKVTIPYQEDTAIDVVLRQIHQEIMALIEKQKLQHARILGIGVSLPGPTKGDRKSVYTVEALSHWRDEPLADKFGAYFDWPVWIDNDCKSAVVGEFYSGKWPGVKNMVLIELGHGVGGGAIINGKLYRGSRQNAGEIGTYFSIIGEEKKPTIRTLLKQLNEAGYSVSDPVQIPDSSNPIVRAWLDNAVYQLRPLVMLTIGWLDPDCVIIAGECPEHLSQTIIDEMNLKHEWAQFERDYPIARLSPTKVGMSLNTYGACMYPVFRTLGI